VFKKGAGRATLDGDFGEVGLVEPVHVDERFALPAAADGDLNAAGFEFLGDRDASGRVARPVTPVDDRYFRTHRRLCLFPSGARI